MNSRIAPRSMFAGFCWNVVAYMLLLGILGNVFFTKTFPLPVCSAQEETSQLAAPNLPIGDINILVLTDVHSWVGGHSHLEPYLNADYGDILSFYERLHSHCLHNQHDLFFVVNGDWIDGTGMAMNGDSFSLLQVLEKMPWDAVNIGNHELYRAETIQDITKLGGYSDWWGERYISSNIVLTETQQPFGSLYHVLRGSKTTVLTFGFLYNMKDSDPMATVMEVETVVEEAWFTEALRSEPFDGILVLAHMNVVDPLVLVILNKIRNVLGPAMPVQFITGHTHRRNYTVLDDHSTSFEAGRYLDTLGFASFPSLNTVSSLTFPNTNGNSTVQDLFQHVYLDPNIEVLKQTLNVEELTTANGADLTRLINRIEEGKGLEEQVGCVPTSFYVERSLYETDSLWKFFVENVVPSQFRSGQALLLGKGSWRYDLVAGAQRMNDVIGVSPFNETLYFWENVSGETILALNTSLNIENDPYLELLPNYILASVDATIAANKTYTLITDNFEKNMIHDALIAVDSNTPDPAAFEDRTTTSIWIKHVQERHPCHGTPGNHHSSSPHGTHSGHSSHNDGSSWTQPTTSNPTKDFWRISLAVLGICCAFMLGALHIWQRGRRFRLISGARERVIMDALYEYNNSTRLYTDDVPPCGSDHSDEVEESDGVFI